MADDQINKTKLPPIIGEEYQPGAQKGTLADFERSPASAYEEAGQREKAAEATKETEAEQEEKKSIAEQQAVATDEQARKEQEAADEMARRKEAARAEESKISTTEEEAAKLAAAAAVNIPYIGWAIRLMAWIVRGLKMITGEKIASFLAIWMVLSLGFAFFNVLPIVGTLLFLIVPPCAAIVLTPFLWPKIKPFMEAADKINITPTKK